MKKIIFLIFLFSLLITPMFEVSAQHLSTVNSTTSVFDTTGFPQWAKDLRRFDIIAFGAFPFSMFFVNTAMDIRRWGDATGFDFSVQGRRYAPWPLKSAGAYELTNDEYVSTILMAAGVSMAIALADLIIINIKRNNERKRLESLPAGIYDIETRPYGVPEEE